MILLLSTKRCGVQDVDKKQCVYTYLAKENHLQYLIVGSSVSHHAVESNRNGLLIISG
jgi:hypothetical protein